jgi:hypothetical protein
MTMSTQRLIVNGLAGADAPTLRTMAKEVMKQLAASQWMEHPLGFYHLRLVTAGDVSLRLHYWPRYERPASSAITPYHDHVWALQSCILAGSIENFVINLESDRNGPYVIANIQQVAGVDAVVPTGDRVRLVGPDVSGYAVGDHYSMPPGVFHSTEVAPEVAAITIVRAETMIKDRGPRTLVPFGYAGQAPARKYLDDNFGMRIVEQVDEILRRE